MTTDDRAAKLFTVGHSNHSLEAFLNLLRIHSITAIADVRSSPYSRYSPQFNREIMAAAVEAAGIRYAFLGRELGARREEEDCYIGAKASYEVIAHASLFRRGLERIRQGLDSYRVALVCAEKDPLTCHRAILICRHLRADIDPIHHILDDGRLESHAQAEARLLDLCGLTDGDLFLTRDELIEVAYDMQGDRIAYVARAGETTEDDP